MNLKQRESELLAQKNRVASLLISLEKAQEIEEKLEVLSATPEVDTYFSFPSPLKTFLNGRSCEEQYLVKALFAIGQGGHLFQEGEVDQKQMEHLLEDLQAVEEFYADSGGLIGYHLLVLTLLTEEKKELTLLPYEGIDIREETLAVRRAILEGIRRQGEMAEIYPVGGAADRLQLKDEVDGEGLPAARLIFLGKPLLEGVISDLQAREYLHYKLFGKQVTTPICMMTSRIHRNHDHIRGICKQSGWFGRSEDRFRFFTQPLVPTFTRKGEWCLQKPLKPLLKPGGHGMLWKLLKKEGVFAWLHRQGKEKALVRQINNPMAAIDYGLLAFLGVGHLEEKAFGFASCSRLVNAHEGMNALQEIDGKQVLTNVEYCDFQRCGIEDKPFEEGGKYSRFPSNTNILFADLKRVEAAAEKCPYPGLLANFRKSASFKEEVARIETMMQNIADGLAVSKGEPLPTYLTFNKRRKTISTTKRKSTAKGGMLETPEGCYYDYMLNAQELLETHCQMALPPFPDEKTFVKEGPSFLFSYHPALGPLYSIIGQKVHGGTLKNGSELQLEIADLCLHDLHLEGSLLIHATAVMGHQDKELLCYSDQTGQCILKNVRVANEGIDWEEDHLFWRHDVKRRSQLKIVLHGHSRFVAEDVTLSDDLTLEVPHGMEMTAHQKEGRVTFILEPLEDKGPLWTYAVQGDLSIALSRNF